MAQMLCGDEVAAIVCDMGTSICKFGSAGHDSPRHIFRSEIGTMNVNEENKLVAGDSSLRNPLLEMDISYPLGPDGINWDGIEALFKYGIEDSMRLESSEYPVMLVENYFNSSPEKQSKTLEMLFESFSCPAVFMGHHGMLSAFSAGRSTALVVDFGATETRVMPIVDGYVLRKAVISTSRAGNSFDKHIFKQIESSGLSLKPWYECPSVLRNSAPPVTTKSFRDMHMQDIIKDIKRWFCFVPLNHQDGCYKVPFIPPYVLPDGNSVLPMENVSLHPELLFEPSRAVSRSQPAHTHSLPAHAQALDIDCETDSLQELVYASLSKCDVDARKDLAMNIVLTGGGALIDGIPARLTAELSTVLPTNMRVKILPALPIERHHAAWIGGSILSICGSFQQMWFSRSEYEEFGMSPVGRKFMR